MMKCIPLILTLLLTSTSALSFASVVYCSGKIENSYVELNGNVIIKGKWRNDWTKLCNTKEDDSIACSLWASYAATAVKDNLDVTVQYVIEDGSTCETLPTYSDSPTPNYLMIYNPAL